MSPRVDQPIPGFYRRKLVKGGPFVGVLIFWGCPLDPYSGEPMQRSPMLRCWVNGEEADPIDQWTWVAGGKITQAEYEFLLADAAHAMEFRPAAPRANPRKTIDLMESELPF